MQLFLNFFEMFCEPFAHGANGVQKPLGKIPATPARSRPPQNEGGMPPYPKYNRTFALD